MSANKGAYDITITGIRSQDVSETPVHFSELQEILDVVQPLRRPKMLSLVIEEAERTKKLFEDGKNWEDLNEAQQFNVQVLRAALRCYNREQTKMILEAVGR